MSVQTIRNSLGQLQDDPDNEEAWSDLAGALPNAPAEDAGMLLSAAREAHAARREHDAVARLLALHAQVVAGTEAEVKLLGDLARTYEEDLFDEAAAAKVRARVLALRPDDVATQEAIERAEAKRGKWEELVTRYVDEARGTEDPAFRSSLLVGAAEVAYRYGRPQVAAEKGGKKKVQTLMTEITTGLTEALEVDPNNRRAGAMLECIYRGTKRWDEVVQVLERQGTTLQSKEEKVACWVRMARVLAKKLGSPERAVAAYERVNDLAPGHPEATSALVDFFTQKEMWDHLVALYDDQLMAAQRSGHVDVGTIVQLAMVHWRMRGKPEAAEPYFERLRKAEPSHPGMLEFFRDVLRQRGDLERLATVLTDAQRALPEGPARAALAAEAAKLAEQGADASKAIEKWRAIHRQDPANLEARDALKRLYRQTSTWNALADLLRTELEPIPADDHEHRLPLLREIATLYREHVKSDTALVTVLSQIVSHDPHDVEALRELAHVYEALQRWRDLLTTQARLAELEQDAGTKAELWRLVARRWLDQFNNVQNAVEAYEKLHACAPADEEATSKLKELYGKRRTYPKLYELLEQESLASDEGPARRELWLEMAKLAAERLDRGADAVRLYKRVIAEDATASAALDALEKQAERNKDFATVAEVLERRVVGAPDDATRLAVLQKLGAVYAERLKDHAGAMRAWKRVLEAQPGHPKALRVLRDTYVATGDYDGLAELYGEGNDWEGLAEVLSNAADRAGDAASKVELSFRAASVYEDKLGAPDRAFRAYERVLSVRPDDKRAAEALVPIYEKEEKWARLPPLYDVLLGLAEDDSEKLPILRRLLVVVGEHLGDKVAAFGYARRAYELCPDDPQALVELEARAAASGQWESFVEALATRADAPDVPAKEVRALRGHLARTYAAHLGKEADAVAIWRGLVETDARDEAAMQALDALLRATDRKDELRWLFDLRVSRANTAQKLEILVDWATLEEEVFSDEKQAMALYRRVLDLVPQHGPALRALARLLQTSGDAQGAVAVLELDRDQREGAERAAREVEIARITLASLARPVAAFDAAKRALDLVPGNADAIAVIVELMALPETRAKAAAVLEQHYADAGDPTRRAAALEVMIASAPSKDERIELHKRLSDVHEALGASDTAFDVIVRAIDDAPEQVDLWDRLAILANRTGRAQALVDAIARVVPEGQPSRLPEPVELDLCERAATLYEEALGETDKARPYLERILARDPANERAFARLKQILTTLERWDDLDATYERALGAAEDGRKIDLLAEIALVAEEITSNSARAMTCYERLLELDPSHEHAASALDALYVSAEKWEALAGLLERRIERALGDSAVALRLRLGTLEFRSLGRQEAALNHLEQVLAANPEEREARELVEACLDVPSLRAKAAGVLEAAYGGGRHNERDLVRILEIRLESAEGVDEKVGLLQRIAQLRDEKLNEETTALDTYARLVPLAPDDTRARERLLDLARRLGAHEQAATVLEAAAKSAAAPQPKAEILGAAAQICEDLLALPERAEALYREMLAVDPNDSAIALPAACALERLYAASAKTKELAEILAVEVSLEDDGDRRREIYGRLGELYESQLDDPKGAINAWKARIDIDPADDAALGALDRLYERVGDHRALVEILRARERGAQDATVRRELLTRLATTLADRLADVPEAISAYRTIVEDFGPERAILEALAKLYELADRWDDLAETLQSELAMVEAPEDQLSLLVRLGAVRQQHLKDLPGALDAYRQALTLQPSHAPSRERLEALLDDEEGRREAAAMLGPLYEADGENEKWLRVLEIEAELADGVDAKLAVLGQAVVVAEQSLGDAARAFGYAARALKEAAGEPELTSWLERTERLAAATGRWKDLVDLLCVVVPEVVDEQVQIDTLVKIAELARDRLADSTLAKEYFQKALSVRADDQRTLEALETLYGQSGEHPALLDILKRRAEAAETDQERRAILVKEARLSDGPLQDPAGAIEIYEQILDIEADDDVLAALERLYRAAARWDDLVGLLERQIGMGLPSDRKARLHHALGAVHLDQRGDPDRAFDEFEAALKLDASHEATVASLEAILKAAESDPGLAAHVPRAAEMLEAVYLAAIDWKRLMSTLRARLSVSQDPDDRKVLLRRLAKLHEEQAEDYGAALEATAQLLAEDLTDETTWNELERLARVASKEQRLAEVFATELAKVTTDEAATAKLARRTAELFEKQGDATRALELYRRAYAFAPEEDDGVFDAIDHLLGEAHKPADRVALYREALEYRNEPQQRLTTLHAIALLQETELGDDDAAINTHRAALDVDETDAHALEALSRLYARRERWNDLAELTRRRAEQSALPEDEARLRLELGHLLKDRLSDPAGALDEYQSVVDLLPPGSGAETSLAAVKALEALLGDESLKARVVELLQPIYERTDAWTQLVAIGRQRLALAQDAGEKVGILREIAKLLEERGGDRAGAFECVRDAFVLDPDDGESRAELDRLGEATARWDDLAAAYEHAIESAEDLGKRELLGALGRLHDQRRDDPRRALDAYERLFRADESDIAPLEQMTPLAMLLSDWSTLVRVLAKKAELLPGDTERASAWRGIGEVRRDMLDDAAGAIDAYEHALDLEPESTPSIDALIELYVAKGDAARLVDLYRRRVELCAEGDEDLKYRLLCDAADRYEKSLDSRREAISLLGDALAARPGDAFVTARLDGLYTAEKMWPELLENLRLQGACESDVAKKRGLKKRIGELLLRELDDAGQALEAFREVLEGGVDEDVVRSVRELGESREELRLAAVDVLEPVLRQANRQADLVSVLELRLRGQTEAADRVRTLRSIAVACEGPLDDAKRAEDAFLRALTDEPAEPELHADVARLAEKLGAEGWSRYADVLEERAGAVFDAPITADLFGRLGRVAEEWLKDDPRAAKAYGHAAEQAGDTAETLASLDRVLSRLGDSKALADVLERRVSVEADAKMVADLRHRLAVLQIREFGDRARGLATLRSALESVPDHEPSRNALEELLEDDGLFNDAFEALEAVYRTLGRTDDLSKLWERKISRATDVRERNRARLDLVRVLGDQAHDPGRAQRVAEAAVLDDPQDADALDELERLASLTDGWRAAGDALGGALEQAKHLSTTARAQAWVRVATWRRDKQADSAAAEGAFSRALDADPENLEVLRALEDLRRTPGRERDLVDTLRKRAKLEADAGTKVELLKDAKSLAESTVADLALAEEVLRDLLAADDGNLWALAELTRLRELAGKPNEVVTLLLRRAELEADGAELGRLRHRAAKVLSQDLGDIPRALALYEEIFDADPTDEAAQAALRELYAKAGRHGDLAKLLDRLVDQAQSESARSALRIDLAKLQSSTGQTDDAIATLRKVLEDNPSDKDAVVALSELLEKCGDDEQLAELLGSQITQAEARGDVDAELTLKVRLGDVYEGRLKDSSRALATYEGVLAKDSSHKQALEAVARLSEGKDDWDRAAVALGKLALLSQGEARVALYLRLADARGKLGDQDAVEEALQSAIAERADHRDARDRLSALYEKAKKWDRLADLIVGDADLLRDANADASAGPAAGPPAPHVAQQVSLLCRAAGLHTSERNKPADAVALLERASALVPADRAILLSLCDAYTASGRERDATQVLEKVVASYGGKRTKDLAVVHHRLAKALASLGEKTEALAQLDMAFKIDPSSVIVLKDLGVLALESGELDRATKTFKALLLQRLDPTKGITKAEVFYYLGEISAKQGDKARAIQMFERAVENDSALEKAKTRLAEVKGT